MSQYIVTTTVAASGNRPSAARSRVWDPARPLALGHPFQWLVEQTEDGVRVRGLSAGAQGPASAELRDISHRMIEAGESVDLPGASGSAVKVRIQKVRHLPPAFGLKDGKGVEIFACAGDWILSSYLVGRQGDSFTGVVAGHPVFRFSKVGDRFELAVSGRDVHVVGGPGGEKVLNAGQTVTHTVEELSSMEVRCASFVWRFSAMPGTSFKPRAEALKPDADSVFFRKALRAAAVAFGAVIALSWLMPSTPPKQEELIPPQFTKIIMTKPRTEKAAAASSAQTSPETVKKVNDAKLVQAFRAEKLQNAVSGLLKGGMTKLLAQSDFVSGSDSRHEAKRLFNAKSEALRAAGPDIGLNSGKDVKVGTLGGAPGASKVGYGQGEHAGVKGQGKAFVSMDINGSSVEEGLTKDEVGEVIHRHLSEVRYCYESAMIRTPDVEGKLIVNFVIGAMGQVKTADVKTSTLPDPRLDDCIIRRLVTWKFPRTKGGVEVAVSYPFIFKTLGSGR
jgi:hypothetical protein